MKPTRDAPASDRPSIFISCVSNEFRTARTKIAETLKFLGYDVEYQDSFPTDAGDLRHLLRQKIDACDGLIQIVGDAYGAEPEGVDDDFGRVSYTQYELLYARSIGKKTWLFFPTDEARRDTPVDQIDLPPSSSESGSSSYQSVRHELQRQYRASLLDGELRWEFKDDTDLENKVLRMRRDLDEIRQEYRQWQTTVQSQQAAIGSRLQRIALIGLGVIIAIGAGFLWFENRTQQGLEKIVDEGATRFRKTETKDIRVEDIYFEANVIDMGIADPIFILSIGPANQDVGYLLKQSEFAIEPVDGSIRALTEQDLGVNATEHRAYQFVSKQPPTAVAITITGPDGDSIGPFNYPTPFEKIRKENGQDQLTAQVRQSMERMMSGRHVYATRPLFICMARDDSKILVDCLLTVELLERQIAGGLREMRFGETAEKLDKRIQFPFDTSSDSVAINRAKDSSRVNFLMQADSPVLFYQGMLDDKSLTEVTEIEVAYFGRWKRPQ